MGFVEKFDFFGTEAIQIPCIRKEGAPTTETEGEVGCLYMDTLTGDVYKCTAVADGVYTWVSLDSSFGVEDTLLAEQSPSFVDEYGVGILVAHGTLSAPLVLGAKYRVLWDGEEYFCTAKDAAQLNLNGLTFKGYYLGNAGLFNTLVGGDEEDTGEPFFIVCDSTNANIATTETAETVSVQKINTISIGFLNEEVVTKEYFDQYINEALGGEY